MERRLDHLGSIWAVAAMVALGGSFAITPLLHGYPVYAGQAIRYATAAAILALIAHRSRRGWLTVTLRELTVLAALALIGLVTFNIALIEGLRVLEPATMGAIVGASPILLATLGPIIEGRCASFRAFLAALVVVAGSTITYGAGPASGRGLIFALAALVCESSFSLIAVPLLPRLGPVLLSAYATGLAAVMLAVTAIAVEPIRPFPRPNLVESAALAYLALVVTAFAFIAWYASVARLGAARAGLFTSIVPVLSALSAVALGTGKLRAAQLTGASLVALGMVIDRAGSKSHAKERNGS